VKPRRALAIGCALSGTAVLLACASSAFGVSARVATATAPPAGGTWKIVPNHSQPGPSINEFDGSFAVKAGKVEKLTATTQRHVNSGCIAGEHVKMVGSAPIRHFLDTPTASDYYYVGKVNGFATVTLTFQRATGTKAARQPHKGTGQLRIFFPGGTETRGGYTAYGNLTYTSSTAGICNVEFSVRAG
jgi:hypothetical protein